MVRQFTFSNLRVPPMGVLERPPLTSESKKVQRVRLSLTTLDGVSRSEDSSWGRPFPCGHTPRPRNPRLLPLPDPSSYTHGGPVLPLEIISLQHSLLGAGQSFEPTPIVSLPELQLHPLSHLRRQVRANREGCAGVKQPS